MLLEMLKKNLILSGDEEDDFLRGLLATAVSYAESVQQVGAGYYTAINPMTPATQQAVIMYASHLYESRTGGTGGFYADSPAAAQQVMNAVNALLACDKRWSI